MIPVDYHLHTGLCGHAAGKIEEYLIRADRAGIREVGFSDHFPLYFLPPGRTVANYAMGFEELPEYILMVMAGREKSRLDVKLGVEVDYVPGYDARLASLLCHHEFDYVTGAVHFIDGWGFDNADEISEYGNRDINMVYEQYFTLVQQAALSGLFDIMAHPDLVKKFNYRPARDLRPLYEDTARAFKKAGVCAEVNTAGLRYPAGEIYPAPEFLQAFFRHRVPVTMGSDAHSPEQVGAGLAEAITMVRQAGYSELTGFKGRKRYTIKI